MLSNDIEIILKKVQISRACHQKNFKILEKIYNTVKYEEFMRVLSEYMPCIFLTRNEFSERTLEFLAQFVSLMTSSDDTDAELNEDIPSHLFLSDVVAETLKYHDLVNESLRFNSCLFIRLLLHYIGTKTQLDNVICDLIQEAMLERTLDPKSTIRLQAVSALVRLQDPLNPDCPVINAYLSLIVEGNPLVRAETVKVIAPYSLTIPHVIKRIQDVDPRVRIIALRRCADIGPKSFKIVERQQVLKCGLSEDHKKVKDVFMENLLVKWLNAYNRDFVEFLKALKLDADENDVIMTDKISKDVMNLLLSSVPINDAMAVLPISDDKLIPVQNLTTECVTLWNVLTSYMRQLDDVDEYLDKILPELTHFSSYIERFIMSRKQSSMEEWQYLDYQQILYNLFEIVEGYDFSDEVGRQKITELILRLIRDESLQSRLLRKLIFLADQLKSINGDFLTDICHVISEIREPLVESTVSQPVNSNNEFEIARSKVKLNILESQLEEASDEKNFLKAHALEEEIIKIREQLKELSVSAPVIEVVKPPKDDPNTICRSLDILIALLQLPNVNALTSPLIAIKDEFVLPLLDCNTSEVNWRVLKCLGLFCIIDKILAEEYVKVLSIPIITYRAISNYNKMALTASVKAVTDLFRIYGSEIFGRIENGNEESNNTTNSVNTTRRRLYRSDEDNSLNDLNRFHLESVIEIILDMLDDENTEIRECAVVAIGKLIRGNFPVTPPFITRIILKWYNPLTGKSSDNLQQILGGTIGNYANIVKGAKEVLAKAVIPIISAIASAPKTSPLADVDMENLFKFLSVLTNNGTNTDVVNIHLNLAHMLCHEILKKKHSPSTSYMVKMLLQLEIPTENITAANELINQVEIALEEVELDKLPYKNLKKFLDQMKANTSRGNNSPETEVIEINEKNSDNNDLTNSTNDTAEQITRTDTGNRKVGTQNQHSQHLVHENNSKKNNTKKRKNGEITCGNNEDRSEIGEVNIEEPDFEEPLNNTHSSQNASNNSVSKMSLTTETNGIKKRKRTRKRTGKPVSSSKENVSVNSKEDTNDSELDENIHNSVSEQPDKIPENGEKNFPNVLRVHLERANVDTSKQNQSENQTININASLKQKADNGFRETISTSKKKNSGIQRSSRLKNQKLGKKNNFNGSNLDPLEKNKLNTIVEDIETSSGSFSSNRTLSSRGSSVISTASSFSLESLPPAKNLRKRSLKVISTNLSESSSDSSGGPKMKRNRK